MIRSTFYALIILSLSVVSTAYANPLLCKIAGHHSWVPYSYIDETENRLVGASITLLEEILKEAGANVEIHAPQPWKRVLHLLTKGHIDLAVSAFKLRTII